MTSNYIQLIPQGTILILEGFIFNNKVWEATLHMVFPLLFYLFLAKSDQIISVLTCNMAEKQFMLEIVIFLSVSFFTFSLFVFPWIPSNSFKPQLIC